MRYQVTGRVKGFNRTVVAYFRTQFVDTKDWPASLPAFYYKNNNRVHRSTKPMTPHQNFFKRPNFSVVVEEQIPMCNLTREKREFLEKAHIDEEEYDAEKNIDNDAAGNTNKEPETLQEIPDLDFSTVADISRTTITIDKFTTSIQSNPLDLSSQNCVDRMPFQDVTNSQVERNTKQLQSGVSSYYKDLYKRRYQSQPETHNKRRYSDSFWEMKENPEHWNHDHYPLELFSKKPTPLATLEKFDLNVGDFVHFKPNSALYAGTNVFLSGYWIKGRVMKINDSKGKVFTVEDCENGKVHILSKYLMRPNML